jgi:signal recognition particle subunit SRP54
MDGSIGQACFDQAKAFSQTVKLGSVIITKLDGHAKGGGSLSAVAATECPIIFIGTGEHFDDFEAFAAESFIKRLLGMGDLSTLFKTVNEAFSQKKQKKMIENISEGKFSMRDMREQYRQVLNMGPLG